MRDPMLPLVSAAHFRCRSEQAIRASAAIGCMLSAIMSPAAASAPEVLQPPPGYEMVWRDEFEGHDQPSPERWVYDTYRNRAGWYNNELQYYARERIRNARVSGGVLIVEAHREDLAPERLRDWNGQRFSSARLTTSGKARWKQGFFEIRARMPCVRGAWPAIWLLPDNHRGNWASGEIDIAEHIGYQPDVIHHAVHTRERNFRRGNHQQANTRVDACSGFHNYQLLWTEDEVIIGVDGVPALVSSAEEFDRPMSLILNVAVGGSWAGAEGVDESAFPAPMEVEYVRVWQPAVRR